MPKTVKGTSARKPPEASADHSDIEDWFGRLMPNLQRIVGEARRADLPVEPERRHRHEHEGGERHEARRPFGGATDILLRAPLRRHSRGVRSTRARSIPSGRARRAGIR